MRPDRMIAFTDGVVAILITILVLELRPPDGHHLSDILDEKGPLLAYLLSFVFVAIYWVNHHHLMQVVHQIDGRTLWANIGLLFCLSLTPIATAWLGQAGVQTGPVAAYAIVLLACALAFTVLTICLLASHGPDSKLAEAIGNDRKGKASVCLVPGRSGVLVLRAVGFRGALRSRRRDLVRARQANRAGHLRPVARRGAVRGLSAWGRVPRRRSPTGRRAPSARTRPRASGRAPVRCTRGGSA